MSFRTDLLSLVDQVRGQVPGGLDLRQFAVTVRVQTWSGSRPGQGTATNVDTPIQNAGQNPKVVHVTQRDVIASGGKYQDEDLRVGPITPAYVTGGTDYSVIDPPTSTSPQLVFYKVVGPGINGWYKAIGEENEANFHYYLILRATSETP